MRGGRPVQVDPRRSARRGRGQVGADEPSLERPLRGDGPPRCLLEQLHADQAGSPGGMLCGAASRRPGRPRGVPPRWPRGGGNPEGCRRGRGGETAGGTGARWDRANPWSQRSGGCRGPVAKAGRSPDGSGQGWEAAWSNLVKSWAWDQPTPYCTAVVGRSNLVSGFRDQTSCRVTVERRDHGTDPSRGNGAGSGAKDRNRLLTPLISKDRTRLLTPLISKDRTRLLTPLISKDRTRLLTPLISAR